MERQLHSKMWMVTDKQQPQVPSFHANDKLGKYFQVMFCEVCQSFSVCSD